jgi:hypothetical protein
LSAEKNSRPNRPRIAGKPDFLFRAFNGLSVRPKLVILHNFFFAVLAVSVYLSLIPLFSDQLSATQKRDVKLYTQMFSNGLRLAGGVQPLNSVCRAPASIIWRRTRTVFGGTVMARCFGGEEDRRYSNDSRFYRTSITEPYGGLSWSSLLSWELFTSYRSWFWSLSSCRDTSTNPYR